MEIISRKKPVIRIEGKQAAVFPAIKKMTMENPGKTAKQLFEELNTTCVFAQVKGGNT